MRNAATKEIRLLAIDPSTRGFGFAILEGPGNLIDWGVKEARENKNSRALELIERYEPDVIVVEDHTAKGSRRCERVGTLLSAIQKPALKSKIRIKRVSQSEVKRAFSVVGAHTKYQIAVAIANKFPELEPRLPPIRKPWMPEDYEMPVFDAAALAVTYFYFDNKKTKAA